MNTITYTFRLSEIGQKTALLAGLPAARKQSIQIPATVEAVSLAEVDADGNAAIAFDIDYDQVPTAETVQKELVSRKAEIDRKKAERAAEQAENFADYDAAMKTPEILDDYLRRRITGYPAHALPGGHSDSVAWCKLHDDEYTDRLPAIRAKIEAEQLAAATAKREREAREAKVKQARITAMHTWAEENGSDRLQQILALQIGDWIAVAEDEFFAANTPDGYSREAFTESDSCTDRRKPTKEELTEYARLKKLVEASNGILSNPRLEYHTIKGREDEYGEWTEAQYYTATDVDITAPTGHTLTVAKIVK